MKNMAAATFGKTETRLVGQMVSSKLQSVQQELQTVEQ